MIGVGIGIGIGVVFGFDPDCDSDPDPDSWWVESLLAKLPDEHGELPILEVTPAPGAGIL